MKHYYLLLFLLFPVILLAQTSSGSRPQKQLYGQVVDAQFQSPLEYAEVIIYDSNGETQITGTVTNATGQFVFNELRPGLYQVRIRFIGFEAKVIEPVEIRPFSGGVDLGIIPLTMSAIETEGVSVEAEKQAIEFKIDKKVINVDKQYTASSGTAVDVLENVPSVAVDADGNVSLRGSSSFTVLIDSRPTVLDANDALQQIPASSIENIEIITNPSAKYDPDGTSGIINILTKKDELNGTSGLINVSAGSHDQYGSGGLINYRTSRYNVYFGADYNKRARPGYSESRSKTVESDTLFSTSARGNNSSSREFFSVKTGIDMFLSDHDQLSAGLRWGGRQMSGDMNSDYLEWTEPGGDIAGYKTANRSDRDGNFYEINVDARHQFRTKGHEISGQFIVQQSDGDDETIDEQRDLNGVIVSGKRTTESGPGNRIRMKMDYTLPLGEKNKFSAGYQGRLSLSKDETKLADYDTRTGTYTSLPQYANNIEYERNIQSLYSLYSGEKGKVGYQGGLRAEYTYRRIGNQTQSSVTKIDRWDFFPSVHFSLSGSKGSQMMASYTRRIERPRGWYFEPFITWMDAYNVRKGNPGLKPEYIDSYELGYQLQKGKNQLSVELYHRTTENKIERIRTVYAPNVLLHTIDNVGTEYASGSEIMLNLWPLRFWTANLMGTVFYNRLKGAIYGETYDEDDMNWQTRFNNTFLLSKLTRFQINYNYRAAHISAQGKQKARYNIDLAFRQELLKNKLSLTFQVRDVFDTRKFEETVSGPDFESYSLRTSDAPFFNLNLSYIFNNYKKEKNQNESQNGMPEENGFDEGGGEF